jgi:NADH dehydrogenase [ubiquinone] 1 alpha subcomplex assembly factor 7
VDFLYLRQYINSNTVSVFGPVTQEHFLHSMGITTRLQVLLGTADDVQRKNLISGYDMLTNPNKMGDRFKFMALLQRTPDIDSSYVPAGFS